MYVNRFILRRYEFVALRKSFRNYFNGIVHVWIQNDPFVTRKRFIEYLQWILRICPLISKLRICNKNVNADTLPADVINGCPHLDAIAFEYCFTKDLDILIYTNLTYVHFLYCEITSNILRGNLFFIKLIKCKCRKENQLGLTHIIIERVITNQSTDMDLPEALEIVNGIPTECVTFYRLKNTVKFFYETEDFVAQNGPLIGDRVNPPRPQTVAGTEDYSTYKPLLPILNKSKIHSFNDYSL